MELISKLKEKVIKAASNESFIHHEWFVEYHLLIVEQIALELCEKYEDANKKLVLVLVWVHDYAKILDKEKEHDKEMLEKVEDLLGEVGFDDAFIEKALEYLEIFEKKMEVDLRSAPIEVQITSSADAASHYIGPLLNIYYRENPDKSTNELKDLNRAYIIKDLELKIVLPEVKVAFQYRFDAMMEQTGDFPEKYF